MVEIVERLVNNVNSGQLLANISFLMIQPAPFLILERQIDEATDNAVMPVVLDSFSEMLGVLHDNDHFKDFVYNPDKLQQTFNKIKFLKFYRNFSSHLTEEVSISSDKDKAIANWLLFFKSIFDGLLSDDNNFAICCTALQNFCEFPKKDTDKIKSFAKYLGSFISTLHTYHVWGAQLKRDTNRLDYIKEMVLPKIKNVFAQQSIISMPDGNGWGSDALLDILLIPGQDANSRNLLTNYSQFIIPLLTENTFDLENIISDFNTSKSSSLSHQLKLLEKLLVMIIQEEDLPTLNKMSIIKCLFENQLMDSSQFIQSQSESFSAEFNAAVGISSTSEMFKYTSVMHDNFGYSTKSEVPQHKIKEKNLTASQVISKFNQYKSDRANELSSSPPKVIF